MPGPVPKRTEVRRRQNKDAPVDKAPASSRRTIPRASGEWHPIARNWYKALAESGQRAFFEPSDWAHAQLVAEGMSRMLHSDRLSAQMFAAIDSASIRLLVTEGDRRRLRIELQRNDAVDEDEDASVASMAEWRDRLSG